MTMTSQPHIAVIGAGAFGGWTALYLLRGGARVTLDLEELDLVDVEGVRFLNECESAGVSIRHCSAYIKEWMLQERRRPQDHPELG